MSQIKSLLDALKRALPVVAEVVGLNPRDFVDPYEIDQLARSAIKTYMVDVVHLKFKQKIGRLPTADEADLLHDFGAEELVKLWKGSNE